MKKIVILVLCLSMTSAAWAGLESSIFASYMDSKDIGNGWGLGLKTELNLWKWLGIDTRVSYLKFDDVFNIDMIPLEAALVLNIPLADQRFNPYGGIGIGYYFMNGNRWDFQDEIGYFPFLGIKAGAKSVSFMGEVRWLGLESSYNNSTNSDVKVDSLGVNLGLVIRW
ncbi:outer membrane beta-barrel protein [Planctomycetota bacterium]